MVPDFRLKDQSGHSHKLSDFRGNIVFLNFWATWCPPCVGEIPLMETLNQRFKAKNFTMVAVSVDQSWDEVRSFFKERGKRPSFLVLLDAEKEVSAGLFNTSKYPETYVIDPKGRLLKKYIGAYDWVSDDKLNDFEEFFAKKTQ